LPIILYDVPCRTACSLTDDTVVRLAEMPQCIGLKDATGDITVCLTCSTWSGRGVSPDFG